MVLKTRPVPLAKSHLLRKPAFCAILILKHLYFRKYED